MDFLFIFLIILAILIFYLSLRSNLLVATQKMSGKQSEFIMTHLSDKLKEYLIFQTKTELWINGEFIDPKITPYFTLTSGLFDGPATRYFRFQLDNEHKLTLTAWWRLPLKIKQKAVRLEASTVMSTDDAERFLDEVISELP